MHISCYIIYMHICGRFKLVKVALEMGRFKRVAYISIWCGRLKWSRLRSKGVVLERYCKHYVYDTKNHSNKLRSFGQRIVWNSSHFVQVSLYLVYILNRVYLTVLLLYQICVNLTCKIYNSTVWIAIFSSEMK